MTDDSMDLDAMLNNPFRNIRPREDRTLRPEPVSSPGNPAARREKPPAAGSERIPVARTEAEESRAERNHPLDLRVLSLEKDEIITARKLDDIRRIIEHQNERIHLLEEELDVLRKALEARDK